MSALGQKQTWRSEFAMSALPPKADIDGRPPDVRFVPTADIADSMQPTFLKVEPQVPRRVGRSGIAQTEGEGASQRNVREGELP
jgi:hypothetical protein